MRPLFIAALFLGMAGGVWGQTCCSSQGETWVEAGTMCHADPAKRVTATDPITSPIPVCSPEVRQTSRALLRHREGRPLCV